MEDERGNSQLWGRFNNYCLEMTAIQKKLDNSRLPQGKREKLDFRFKDLERRIVPKLVHEISS